MPHHFNFTHHNWADLPPQALKAARILGYTQDIWDEEKNLPYYNKTMATASIQEKQAAMYLGMDPLWEKCDLDWKDIDSMTKDYATTLGWDETKWDEDWDIVDLEIEHKFWKDLTHKERQAAEYFGYIQCTWDEVEGDFAATHRMGSMFQGEKVQNSTGGKPAASNFYKEEDKNENDGPMGKALDFCTNLCFKSSPLAMIVNKIRKN